MPHDFMPADYDKLILDLDAASTVAPTARLQ